MKDKKGWLILLIGSIIVLLGASVAIGFYNQIVASGFYPEMLFMCIVLLSVSGIITASVNLADMF